MSAEQNKGEGCVIWGAFILFFGFGVFLILWNASRAANEKANLDRAIELAVKLQPDVYDPSLDGELVVIAGSMRTDYVFDDVNYGIVFNGANYVREVAEFREYEEELFWSPRQLLDNGHFSNEYRNDPFAYGTDGLKLKATDDIFIGIYRIDSALLNSDDLFETPISIDQYLVPEKANNSFHKVDFNVLTNSKDLDNPRLEDLEVVFRGLPSGSNITVLGMQKDSAIVKPDWRIPYGAIRGYKDAKAVTVDLSSGEEKLDLDFRAFGIMALFVGSLAFRFIIRKFLYKLMKQNLLALRGHVFLTTVALCAFSYWTLSGLGYLLFAQALVPGSTALGKAALVVVPFILLVRNKIPGFLFKETIAEETN